MKGVIAGLILLLLFSASTGTIEATASGVREIPFTQDDRDRLIRVETRMDALEKRMDVLKSDMDKKFDQMMTFMLWGFGILFGGMGVLMTTVIWDRRTALAPVIRKTKELEERGDKIERTIKELKELDFKYSEISEIKEVLKRAGLL